MKGLKIKKEYIVLALVIVALVFYLVMRKTDRTHYALPDIPKVDGKAISKIEINSSGDAIVLTKRDSAWFIGPEEFPADSKKINGMLESVEALAVTALVSESRNYNRYDLDGDKKIAVKAWSGTTLSRDFAVGKTASTYQHTFVKFADDPNAYHARGNFRSRFDQSVEDLRDRVVLSFKKDDITEISISEAERTTVVSKSEVAEDPAIKKDDAGKTSDKKTVWQTADGKKADEAALEGFLSYLSDFECDGYTTDKRKEDPADPVYVLTLKGGEERSLSIFGKKNPEDKNNPAASSQNKYAFLVSESKVNHIKDTIKKITGTEEDAPDPKAGAAADDAPDPKAGAATADEAPKEN